MNSKREQRFDKRYAQELFRIGLADFRSAWVLAHAQEDIRPEIVFFYREEYSKEELREVLLKVEEALFWCQEKTQTDNL
jgi:hypothetical protein